MKFKDLKQGDYFYCDIGNDPLVRCIKTKPIESIDGFSINAVNLSNGDFLYVGIYVEVVEA